ncbi:hypothetical protein Pstu01_32490 [Stutzerimonas stutzeri]|nr:hypothetical protein Pstu01_32490 [Stutzerimonas stutzeri]
MMRWAREAVIGWQRGKRKTVNSRKGGQCPGGYVPAFRGPLIGRLCLIDGTRRRRFESAIG